VGRVSRAVSAGLLVAGVLIGLLVQRATVNAQDASPEATKLPLRDGPSLYCQSNGGIVRERTPIWGANLAKEQQVVLGPSKLFCEFTEGPGAEPANTWIIVSLDTLYSEEATLASLAYLTKPPLPTDMPAGVNPASVYCSHLGGSDQFGGTTGAGGGWVTTDTDTPIDVLEACVFPDGSIIDSWGITYHTNGTIRGTALTTIFRYQPKELPHVFPEK
jgi:putative hemolysin